MGKDPGANNEKGRDDNTVVVASGDISERELVPIGTAGEIDDGGFPWKLIPADDAPLAGEWSFCAFDPLWGLEKPDLTQPESPYIGLRPFTHQEAGVFFGRRAEIRELYDAVMTPGGSPLLFYYGQSGVGKSSVLDAGLVPWLSPYRTVRYVRRDPNLGLLGTLRHELSTAAEKGAMDHTTDILQLWQDAAARPPGRPMVVILDQAEEVFTKPFHAEAASPSTYSKDSSQAELAAFFDSLRPLLNEPGVKPRDRLLILGFRKEWQPEFSRIAREAGLTPGEVFLKPLGRQASSRRSRAPACEMRAHDHGDRRSPTLAWPTTSRGTSYASCPILRKTASILSPQHSRTCWHGCGMKRRNATTRSPSSTASSGSTHRTKDMGSTDTSTAVSAG